MAVTTPPVVAGGLGRSWRRRSAGLLLSLLALTALMAISVTIGSRAVAAEDILSAFGGSTDGFGPAAVATRIPRTLLAVIVGAALSVSGAVMQGVTRNPLADPGILGIKTGASLAVVIGIAHFSLTSASSMIWVAILGAGTTAVQIGRASCRERGWIGEGGGTAGPTKGYSARANGTRTGTAGETE